MDIIQNQPRNIQINRNRFFINVSIYGCGNSCEYCYVKGSKNKQRLIEIEELKSSLHFIENQPTFSFGSKGALISLCPDTEPFKSKSSAKLVKCILEKFLPLSNPIQISTKQVIPEGIIRTIKTHQKYKGQITIFTSNNTISQASNIEPFAAPIDQRFKNFKICKEYDINSCLYIKPITNDTLKDYELYIKKIKEFKPDSICMGILYECLDKKIDKLVNFKHPSHSELIIASEKTIQHIWKFKELISKEIYIPIFHSSICVSAYARNYFPIPHIWDEYKELCVNCRDCKGQYERELLNEKHINKWI